jgi:filamentous hemagglutinin family protein
MRNLRSLLKYARVFRSRNNAHSYFYFMDGHFGSFATHIDDIANNVAQIFAQVGSMLLMNNNLRRCLPLFALLTAMLTVADAQADNNLPIGFNPITPGVALSQPDSQTMVLHSSVNRSIVEWQNFSIGKGYRFDILQPNAQSMSVQVSRGPNPSLLYGQLNSNGGVMVVNPAGIVVGSSGVVNVSNFFASTLPIQYNDFLSGKFSFRQDAALMPGAVVNNGQINVTTGGLVALIGGAVENNGAINAPAGHAVLAAGKQVSVMMGNGVTGVDVTIDEGLAERIADVHSAIVNSGTINAATVQMLAKLESGLYDLAVNNTGRVLATRMEQDPASGKIVLKATSSDGQSATTFNSGTLDASNADGQGGSIQVLGDRVALLEGSQVNASGSTAGGQVLIGGDYKGANPEVHNAKQIYIDEHAFVAANATGQGDGGKIIVWGEDTAQMYGNLSARGGEQGGNGGFIETSSRNWLDVTKAVDVSAPKGQGGTWLLDPRNLTIVDGAVDTGINQSGSLFRSAQNSSLLSVNTINTALGGVGGANVIVETGSSGAQQGNLTWNASTALSGGANRNLTLKAHNDVIVDQNLTVQSGPLNLTLTADLDNANTGNVLINRNINLNGGNLTLSGQSVQQTGAAAIQGVDNLSVTATKGNIALNNPLNDVNTLASTAQTGIEFADANNLQVTNALISPTDNAADVRISAGNDLRIVSGVRSGLQDGGEIHLTAGTAGQGSISLHSNVRAGSRVVLTSSGTGTITQTGGAITTVAGERSLKVQAATGDVSLNRTVNSNANLEVVSTGGNVSYVNNGNLNVVRANLVGGPGKVGNLLLNTQGGLLTQSAGAGNGIQAAGLGLYTGGFTLENPVNDVANLTAKVDVAGTSRYSDSDGFQVRGVLLPLGSLSLKTFASGSAVNNNADPVAGIDESRLTIALNGVRVGDTLNLTANLGSIVDTADAPTVAKNLNIALGQSGSQVDLGNMGLLDVTNLTAQTVGGAQDVKIQVSDIDGLNLGPVFLAGSVGGGSELRVTSFKAGPVIDPAKTPNQNFESDLNVAGPVNVQGGVVLKANANNLLVNSDVTGRDAVFLGAMSADGTVALGNNAAVSSEIGIKIVGDNIDFPLGTQLSAPSGRVVLTPFSTDRTIGLGDGVTGGLLLSADEIGRVDASSLFIGGTNDEVGSGTSYSGLLNLGTGTSPNGDLVLNTLGAVLDATPADDTLPNITMGAGDNLYIGGGINETSLDLLAATAASAGASQVGDDTPTPQLGDLDIALSPSSTIALKLPDFFGTGTSFQLTTLGGFKGYINVPEVTLLNTPNTVNLFASQGLALNGRSSLTIDNEAKGQTYNFGGFSSNPSPSFNFASGNPAVLSLLRNITN